MEKYNKDMKKVILVEATTMLNFYKVKSYWEDIEANVRSLVEPFVISP